jgi:nucleotide-binding universal stress UspA family protein
MTTTTDTLSNPTPGETRIVVGVDGSTCARQALEFAIAEATRWGALLHVISAYEIPTTAGAGWVVVPLGPFQEAAAAELSEALSRIAELAPDLVVKGEIEHGPAGQILIEASQGAALLVVGSRGRGELAALVLGSVSEHCAHHAHCPVTIVR